MLNALIKFYIFTIDDLKQLASGKGITTQEFIDSMVATRNED